MEGALTLSHSHTLSHTLSHSLTHSHTLSHTLSHILTHTLSHSSVWWRDLSHSHSRLIDRFGAASEWSHTILNMAKLGHWQLAIAASASRHFLWPSSYSTPTAELSLLFSSTPYLLLLYQSSHFWHYHHVISTTPLTSLFLVILLVIFLSSSSSSVTQYVNSSHQKPWITLVVTFCYHQTHTFYPFSYLHPPTHGLLPSHWCIHYCIYLRSIDKIKDQSQNRPKLCEEDIPQLTAIFTQNSCDKIAIGLIGFHT